MSQRLLRMKKELPVAVEAPINGEPKQEEKKEPKKPVKAAPLSVEAIQNELSQRTKQLSDMEKALPQVRERIAFLNGVFAAVQSERAGVKK